MVLFASQAFQRQVQECLTQLELINKQYRRLARENRTDSSCHLRQMVHDGNRRWDVLQRRVAAILRRLKVILSVISYTLPFKSLVSVKNKTKKNTFSMDTFNLLSDSKDIYYVTKYFYFK